MQPSVAVPPSQPSPSFAGFLAAFAQPEKKFPPTRDDEGLADDIVTLSYEHALRNHARYRPAEISASEREQGKPDSATAPQLDTSTVESSDPRAARVPAVARNGSALMEKNLKRASITIRLSQSECAQLHQRAAESGLTVSAYLRSCTLEVEALRAQVKEALAQLRSANSGQVVSNQTLRTPAAKARSFWSRFWAKMWPLAKAQTIPA